MKMSDLMINADIHNLDIGNRTGWTDYIDFISGEDLKYPIMKGVDIFSRPFLVFRVKVGDKIFSQTFFQRYTNGNGWMCARGGDDHQLLHTYGGMTLNQFNFIDKIIKGKDAIVTEDIRPMDVKLIGEKVTLYDEKKEKAAIIIQRNWNRCRWDPNYKMCGDVMMKNIEILRRDYISY